MIVEKLMRLGMSRAFATAIFHMYDNKKPNGFTAAEVGLTDETIQPLMGIRWIRPVNVAMVDNEYCLMYQLNDLYKVINGIIAEKAELLKQETKLAREIKKSLNTVKVNNSRPPANRIGRPKKGTPKVRTTPWAKQRDREQKKLRDQEREKREHEEKLEVLRKFREEQSNS